MSGMANKKEASGTSSLHRSNLHERNGKQEGSIGHIKSAQWFRPSM
jgi:hypothetical protein